MWDIVEFLFSSVLTSKFLSVFCSQEKCVCKKRGGGGAEYSIQQFLFIVSRLQTSFPVASCEKSGTYFLSGLSKVPQRRHENCTFSTPAKIAVI